MERNPAGKQTTKLNGGGESPWRVPMTNRLDSVVQRDRERERERGKGRVRSPRKRPQETDKMPIIADHDPLAERIAR